MTSIPANIGTVAELQEALSEPADAVVESLASTDGDIMLLGVGGKIGPDLAVMARRALDAAGSVARVFGVARNLQPPDAERLEKRHALSTPKSSGVRPWRWCSIPAVRSGTWPRSWASITRRTPGRDDPRTLAADPRPARQRRRPARMRRSAQPVAALLHPATANAERLTAWIRTTRQEDPPHLHAFTRGLEQDRDAVDAAVMLPHHNGTTEGVNTKTKLLKRQMYGRAGFPLLRHRILLG